MSQPENTYTTDDPEALEESLFEAREILEDVLEQVANAAFSIGSVRGLLPVTPEGEVEFDEEDLVKTGHPTLVAIAAIAEAIYKALDTLPDFEEEGDDDEDEDEEDEGEEK
jgi:hypothetical protein